MMGALIATYLTATVEWVEAYTIVLAVALSIGWPRALGAAGSALLFLAVLTTIGSLIRVRWLGKAIARGAGLKKLHDEDAEFAGLRARADIHEARAAWWIAFNGTLLEGLEVWLIVVALGVQTHHTLAASAAAAVALIVVCVAGILARKPLAKVPENTIKFTVGSGILSFGTFWILESLGYKWPLGDATLLVLFGFYVLGGLALIRLYSFKSAASGVA